MCVMETACSKVPLHPSPQRTHLQDSELPAFVRPAGRSREKVHSDWPHVPCTDPWGLGKCAWNKPPGPWWSWSTSPSPRHPGFTSSGSHSGLRLTLWAQAISGVGGRVVWGHLCPPTAVPCPHDAFQPPVGKSGPEDYLSRPGSGEDGSGMGH